MIEHLKKIDASVNNIKKFAFFLSFLLAAVAVYLFWKAGFSGSAWRILSAISVLLSGLAVFKPALLKPLFYAWMAFGFVMNRIMTALILFVVFYFMITPIGLVMRISGRHSISSRPDNSRSYWQEPAERTENSCERQF